MKVSTGLIAWLSVGAIILLVLIAPNASGSTLAWLIGFLVLGLIGYGFYKGWFKGLSLKYPNANVKIPKWLKTTALIIVLWMIAKWYVSYPDQVIAADGVQQDYEYDHAKIYYENHKGELRIVNVSSGDTYKKYPDQDTPILVSKGGRDVKEAFMGNNVITSTVPGELVTVRITRNPIMVFLRYLFA